MKTKVKSFVAATAMSLLLVPTFASAKTTVLRYSNWLPAGQAMRTQVIEPWIAEVEKVTEGRVKIETLPKVIGSVAGQFDVARDGQADIVVIVNGYTPGRFTIGEIIELPFLGDNPEIYAPVVHRFYEKHLAQYGEYKGVHPLSVFVVSPGQLFNSKHPVRSMKDFEGLKIRSPQPAATEALRRLGAVPVSRPASETYELMSSGILDGTMMPPESIPAFNLTELARYGTIVPGALYNSTLSLLINERKWKSLSEKDREAISAISGETFARNVGRTYRQGDLAAWEAMRKAGMTVDTVGPELLEEMKAALKPLEAEWIEKARKKGVENPERLLEELRAEIAAAQAAAK